MVLLSTLLTIAIISLIILLYGLYNILMKYEKLEDDINEIDEYVLNLYEDMKMAYDKMLKLDTIGSFEADDETGFVFSQMKKSIDSIAIKYNLDGSQEKE
jgi:adenylate cyclase